MNIVIYGINYYPELTGIGRYSGEMGKSLKAVGHDVSVVCAPPYYPNWCVAKGYSPYRFQREKLDGVDVIRCPVYVPQRVTTLKRLFHLFSFSFSSFWALLFIALTRHPQIIFIVVPTLFCLPGALLIAKLLRIKTVLHIQDYELDAMLGLSMAGGLGGKGLGVLGKAARNIERHLMRHLDVVSTISYSMMDLAVKKGVNPSRLMFFPNWVDTGYITPSADRTLYRTMWGISESERVILYSGNIGAKQGLSIIADVAERLQSDPNLRFVIVGDGAYREELMALVRNRGLKSVVFYPLQPYENLPALMALADVHLVVQRRGAADVVLPSKLTAILSAGGYAVITADANTELGQLCMKHTGIAIPVEPENPDALVHGIREALANRERQGFCNVVARDYAEKFLDQTAILQVVEQRLRTTAGVY